jgi:hypothetical protein
MSEGNPPFRGEAAQGGPPDLGGPIDSKGTKRLVAGDGLFYLGWG